MALTCLMRCATDGVGDAGGRQAGRESGGSLPSQHHREGAQSTSGEPGCSWGVTTGAGEAGGESMGGRSMLEVHEGRTAPRSASQGNARPGKDLIFFFFIFIFLLLFFFYQLLGAALGISMRRSTGGASVLFVAVGNDWERHLSRATKVRCCPRSCPPSSKISCRVLLNSSVKAACSGRVPADNLGHDGTLETPRIATPRHRRRSLWEVWRST